GVAKVSDGTVNFTVAASTTPIRRTGTLTIAGQLYTVNQGALFNDVSPSHPFFTEIGKLSAHGVTSGCGQGNFCPEEVVTREQMAIFIIRSLGITDPGVPSNQRFLDVDPT